LRTAFAQFLLEPVETAIEVVNAADQRLRRCQHELADHDRSRLSRCELTPFCECGGAEIQLDLFYDYRTNVPLYPGWQEYFRKHQPATLVLFVQAAKFEAGLVHFSKNARYLPDLLAELLAFPNGKHDDQVDSISQALAYEFSGYTLDNVRG